MMHICAGLVGTKIENVHTTAARSKFLKNPPNERDLDPAGWDPIRGHFGVILPTLELVWEHFGYIKVVGIILICICFRKTHVSPLDFNDFIQFKSQLGGTFGSFGVILGL